MNKTLKAADEVRKLNRMFQALGEVVEVLDRVGSAEQAEQEAAANVEKLKKQAEGINVAMANAEAQASAIVDAAQAKALEIGAEASRHAEEIKAKADRLASDLVASASAKMADADEAKAAAASAVAEAEAKRSAIAAEVEDLERRAEKARSYLAKLAS